MKKFLIAIRPIRDPPVQEMPVQSMITSPSPHDIIAAVKSGCRDITVKGIAWGGGGLGVARVDVSVDDGVNFTRAELVTKPIVEKRKSQWSWQFFEKRVALSDSVRFDHHITLELLLGFDVLGKSCCLENKLTLFLRQR